jgi:hypothetical protein
LGHTARDASGGGFTAMALVRFTSCSATTIPGCPAPSQSRPLPRSRRHARSVTAALREWPGAGVRHGKGFVGASSAMAADNYRWHNSSSCRHRLPDADQHDGPRTPRGVADHDAGSVSDGVLARPGKNPDSSRAWTGTAAEAVGLAGDALLGMARAGVGRPAAAAVGWAGAVAVPSLAAGAPLPVRLGAVGGPRDGCHP